MILSDASPQLSGIKDLDQLRSRDLAETALKIADFILKPSGNLVIKFFQGNEFDELLQEIKKQFKIVKTTKPDSSRKGSAEMYLVCKSFR